MLAKGGLAPWQLRRIVDHIESNLTQSLSMTELAGMVQLSRCYFTHAFKRSVGETPRAFIIRQRVRRAQSLLLTTRTPLGQIAFEAGFCDQAHLTRMFGRLVGETPFIWRRRHEVW